MSVEGFVQHSCRGALLAEEPLPAYYYGGHIKVFDIDDELFFGAWYPDNSRVACPKGWFPRAQRRYDQLKAEGKLFPPTPDGIAPYNYLAPERDAAGLEIPVTPPPARAPVSGETDAGLTAAPAPAARPPLRRRTL